MTKPRYLSGCAAGSQQGEIAPYAGNSDYAWNVNFNNGNSNWNNVNNDNQVRPCRPSEYHGAAVTFIALERAYREARRAKRPSENQLSFESQWLDRLHELRDQLNAGTWRPLPPTCFVTTKPKAREIHAPDFSDRVVHHWLVPQLEAIYEPVFIHDSYSNRTGKGTHAAVDRLRSFVRQVHSGQGGGWYLQLDIRNFFNSIHRPTLYALLKSRMARYPFPMAVRLAVHALLRRAPLSQGVTWRATAAERAQVPEHKRLENAAPGCGLPIGNLSSQFFANVYLNELDQFVKHQLKVPRYVRYVDDFVLVHKDRAQLETWKAQIEHFLSEHLRLALKPDFKLRPLSAGIDFLGYVVLPTHARVRRRVVAHAREKLRAWEQENVRPGAICATPAAYRALESIWRSYEGHLSHAASFRLRQDFHRRFPWLHAATSKRRFHHSLTDQFVEVPYR